VNAFSNVSSTNDNKQEVSWWKKTDSKLAKPLFKQYGDVLGFECHFQAMAMKLLLSNKNPHTVLIMQCPLKTCYGMARVTVTGDAMLTFFKPIQVSKGKSSNYKLQYIARWWRPVHELDMPLG
jgi:hypothetical protein